MNSSAHRSGVKPNRLPYISCLLAFSLFAFGSAPSFGKPAEHTDAFESVKNADKNSENEISALVLSPDGTMLASVDGTNTSLFQVPSGKIIRTIKGGGYRIAFSPDGKLLAVAASNNQIRIFDVSTGKESVALSGSASPKGNFIVLTFSPDGTKLVSTDHTKSLTLWDLSTGHELFTSRDKNGDIVSAAFSSDGKTIGAFADPAPADFVGTVHFWNAASGQRLYSMPSHSTLASSPSDQRFVTCKGTVTKVAEVDGNHEVKILDADLCTLSPDGSTLIGGNILSHHYTTRIFDAKSGTELHKVAGMCPKVAVSGDSKRLVTTALKTAWVWEIATGKKLATFNRPLTTAAALSSDGKLCALSSGSPDENDKISTIELYDVSSGKLLQTLVATKCNVSSIAFSPDNKQLVAASYHWPAKPANETTNPDQMQIWEVSSGRELRKWLVGAAPYAVAFSPDGKILVTAFMDNTLKVNEAATAKEICTLNLDRTLWSGYPPVIGFSPDSKIVYGANQVAIKSWNLSDGHELSSTPVDFLPNSIAVDSSGKPLVSGLADQLQIIDSSGKEIQSIITQEFSFFDIAFGKDGKFLYGSGSFLDHNLRVWDVATGKKVKEIPLATSDKKMGATVNAKFCDDFKWMAISRGPSIEIYDVEGKQLVKTVSPPENQDAGSTKPVIAQ
jgi:WD40 repeat protein